jgi:aspartyl protease family protein
MIRLPIECCGAMMLSSALALGLSMLVPASDTLADTGETARPVANVAIASENLIEPIIELSSARRVIARAPDGLCYVEAQANGQTIRFVVDTGATVVVLNRSDAKKMGIAYEKLLGSDQIKTVGGPSAMRWATIDHLETAGRELHGLNAAVVDQGLPVSLMGQNALSRLGSVTMRGDTLTID